MTPAVVVPTYNEGPQLADLVRSIELGVSGRAVEMLFVDGGSTDDTATELARLKQPMITAPRGRASQMNAGAKATSGDPIVFLHADTRLEPEAFDAIEDCLKNPRVVFGSFPIRFELTEWRYRLIAAVANLRTRLDRSPYGDQAIFVRRDSFERVDGYPDVPLMEELALGRRLKQLGDYELLSRPCVMTSARRWQRHGVLKTTLKHWLIRMGYELGVSTQRLAALHGPPLTENNPEPNCEGRRAAL